MFVHKKDYNTLFIRVLFSQNITNYIICRKNQLVEQHLWYFVLIYQLGIFFPLSSLLLLWSVGRFAKVKNGCVLKAICSQIKRPSNIQTHFMWNHSSSGGNWHVKNGLMGSEKMHKIGWLKESIAKRLILFFFRFKSHRWCDGWKLSLILAWLPAIAHSVKVHEWRSAEMVTLTCEMRQCSAHKNFATTKL